MISKIKTSIEITIRLTLAGLVVPYCTAQLWTISNIIRNHFDKIIKRLLILPFGVLLGVFLLWGIYTSLFVNPAELLRNLYNKHLRCQ